MMNLIPYAVCFSLGCFVGVLVYKSNPDNIKAAYQQLQEETLTQAGEKE